MTRKSDAIKAANRADDRREDRKDERAEDREESLKAAPVAPAPAVQKGAPKFYPKWVKLGDLTIVVSNEAEERAALDGTANVSIVKSAQGDQVKIV